MRWGIQLEKRLFPFDREFSPTHEVKQGLKRQEVILPDQVTTGKQKVNILEYD